MIILSPAKSLKMDTETPYGTPTQPQFLKQSEVLVKVLRTKSEKDLSELMSISEKLSKLNAERYRDFQTPFTKDNATPCIYAFDGDVYEGLDAASLSKDEIAFAQDNVRILSGLYGMLRPLDLMQAYRLEMGTKLSTKDADDLYGFWGEQIGNALDEVAPEIIVNLASNEYSKAAKLSERKAKVITPVFKENKNGTLKIVSFYAKKARGVMTRWLVKEQAVSVDAIKAFAEDGYRFDADRSTDTELLFVR